MIFGKSTNKNFTLVEIRTAEENSVIANAKPGQVISRVNGGWQATGNGDIYGVISPTDLNGRSEKTEYKSGDQIPIIIPHPGCRVVCRAYDSTIVSGQDVSVDSDGYIVAYSADTTSKIGFAIGDAFEAATGEHAVEVELIAAGGGGGSFIPTQVQADWNEENQNSISYIWNKPIIPESGSEVPEVETLKVPLGVDGTYTDIGLTVTVTGGTSELQREALLIRVDHEESDIENTYYTVMVDDIHQADPATNVTVTITPENPSDSVSFDSSTALAINRSDMSLAFLDIPQNSQSFTVHITPTQYNLPFRLQKRLNPPAGAHIITVDGAVYPIDNLTDFIYAHSNTTASGISSTSVYSFVSDGETVEVQRGKLRVFDAGVSSFTPNRNYFGGYLFRGCTNLEVIDFSQSTALGSDRTTLNQYFYYAENGQSTVLHTLHLPPLPDHMPNLTDCNQLFYYAFSNTASGATSHIETFSMRDFPTDWPAITNLESFCYCFIQGIKYLPQPGDIKPIPPTWTTLSVLTTYYHSLLRQKPEPFALRVGMIPELPHTLVNLTLVHNYLGAICAGSTLTDIEPGAIPGLPPESTAIITATNYCSAFFGIACTIDTIPAGTIPPIPNTYINLQNVSSYLSSICGNSSYMEDYDVHINHVEVGAFPPLPSTAVGITIISNYFNIGFLRCQGIKSIGEGVIPAIPSTLTAITTAANLYQEIAEQCFDLEEIYIPAFPVDGFENVVAMNYLLNYGCFEASALRKFVLPPWERDSSLPSINLSALTSNCFNGTPLAETYGNTPISSLAALKAGLTAEV